MRNRTAQETSIKKTPNPTPLKAIGELSDAEVRSVAPSSAVVDAVEPSLLVAEVVVGNSVVLVTGSPVALRTAAVVVVVVGAAAVVVVKNGGDVVVVVSSGAVVEVVEFWSVEVVDGGGRVKVRVLGTLVVTVLVVAVVVAVPVVEVVCAGEDPALVDVEALAVSGGSWT
jgi:hypothetical protein